MVIQKSVTRASKARAVPQDGMAGRIEPDHATGHAARRGAGLVVFLADRPFKNSSCLESRLTATGAEMVGPIAPRSRAHVPSAWTACPMRSGGTLHARGIAVRMFCVLTTYG